MAHEPWVTKTPDLVADVYLYSVDEGGKSEPVRQGYYPPCCPEKDRASGGWDARMQLGDLVFEPGTTQRIGFVFLWPESVQHAKNAGKFYLWDGRIIGEAIVVPTGTPDPDHETPIQMK